MDKAKITGILQVLAQRSINDLLIDDGTAQVVPVSSNKFDINFLPDNSGRHELYEVHVTLKRMY